MTTKASRKLVDLRTGGGPGFCKAAAFYRAVLDRHTPTADETCPVCGSPTQSRYSDTYGVLPVVVAEACTSCGWLAEFTEGGEAA